MGSHLTLEALASFTTLTFLEVVLGVDNIIFLAMAVNRLAPDARPAGRRAGLALAMLLRILMLVSLVWVTRLEVRLFAVLGRDISMKDLVLIAGGLFLLWKGTGEIHDVIESPPHPSAPAGMPKGGWARMGRVIAEIGMINIVFSIDSVVTAVGMTSDLTIMIAAVVASTAMMLFAAAPVGEFIEARPTMRVLALAFILLVGVALVADGLGFHIPRGYIYFAIAFSLVVETLNTLVGRRGGVGGAGPPE